MDVYKVLIRSVRKLGFNDDAVSSGKNYRKINARVAKKKATKEFVKDGVENS